MSASENTSSPPFILEVATLMVAILLGAIGALTVIVLFINNLVDFSPVTNIITRIQVVALPATVQVQLSEMGLPLTGDTPAYWYMSRASALLSFFFMWLSVLWGLLLSTKVFKKYIPAVTLFSAHEFLSFVGLGFASFHAGVLLGDRYIAFRLSDILLPFSASFKPNLVGIGTLTLYLYALVVLSFYIRKKIGRQTWRALHVTTFFAFVLAALHGIFTGTDSGLNPVRIMYASAMLSVFPLIALRIFAAPRQTAYRRG